LTLSQQFQIQSSTDNPPANQLWANGESSSAAQKKNISPEHFSPEGTFSDRPELIRGWPKAERISSCRGMVEFGIAEMKFKTKNNKS
jgi:hypothetical protein